MISKATRVIILCFAISAIATGQDYHFSGFMQNMVYVNPATAAMVPSGEVGLVYRNQWPGIPATFVTYGASLLLPVPSLKSGFGISAVNDMQGGGVISRTSATLMYGYHIELDRNWEVGAGISASFVFKDFNADQLVLRSDILNDLGYSYTTLPYENYNRTYPDFSAGIIARNEALSFGFTVNHLTRPVESGSELFQTRLPLKYTGFVSGRIGKNNYRDYIAIEPAAFFSMQKQNQEIIWGTAIDFSSKFMLGGWLRHNLNLNFDALIVSAGISWEKYNIGYHYDVNLKKFSFLSTKMAAHEVTFLYRFEYKEQHKVKRFRKSECPAY